MRKQDRNVYHPKSTRGALVSLLGRLLLLYIAGRADVKIKIIGPVDYWVINIVYLLPHRTALLPVS